MPADPTDADRERAAEVWRSTGQPASMRGVAAVAQALADERERARAPFLALADELASWPSVRIMSPHDAADRIRAAAQEDPK